MLTFLCAVAMARQASIPLDLGMEIIASCRIQKRVYAVTPPTETQTEIPGKGVVTVRGDNITVDFQGATLEGSPTTTEPNNRAGTGLDISGKNVTIEHAVIRGYKVGLIARHAPGLKLIACDFSYNWKQHLKSTIEKEDESDWQSYHHNENEEWLRYGAGAYLQDVDGFEVRDCRATGGQCGLMLCRCNHGKVWNNDFSFLSGLGLGMYRSCDNVVMHNKMDWCVRGFSYGVYNRGQDSAGILAFEQCSRNMFAYNSVTHGGDGFFLWAGQTTMDTGKGGCNDNVLYANDFSHSPANGIEATFSRNRFIYNLCVECDYGIWGGYSYDTTSQHNWISACRVGAAFEHSQKCSFYRNIFDLDKIGIQLWGGGKPDPNFGYSKNRDVRALDNSIIANNFEDITGPSVWLRETEKTVVESNAGWDRPGVVDADAKSTVLGQSSLPISPNVTSHAVPGWATSREFPGDIDRLVEAWNPFAPPDDLTPIRPLADGQNPFLPKFALRGRKYMLVDEWGPYDFRSPRLWPRGEDANGNQVFEVLGPKGKWSLESVKGAQVVGASSGEVPSFINVRMPGGSATNIDLKLKYVGASTTDYRGITTPAGKSVTFNYSQFFAPINWTSEFFQWDKDTDPRTHDEAFRVLLAGPPIATAHSTKLEFSGYGAWAKGVPENNFAISANGDFTIDKGKYTLDLTTDDGCRVFLDGKSVQLYDEAGKPASAFHYQGPTSYTAPLTLSQGKHHLYVEYFQIDGYKALSVKLKPG